MNEQDGLATNEKTVNFGDNQSQQIVRGQRSAKLRNSYEQRKVGKSLRHEPSRTATRRLKSDKSIKSKKGAHRSFKHNIFMHDEGKMNSTEIETTLNQMRMVDNLSKHTSEPLERNAPTYAPAPTDYQASGRVPTRQRDDDVPPTRTGASGPIDKYAGSSSTTEVEEPCPEFENRDTYYLSYQNLYENNKGTETGNDQIDGNDNAVFFTNDKEEASNQDTILGDINEINVNIMDSFEEEGNSRAAWKYVMLVVGFILCGAVLALFLRKRSRTAKSDNFGLSGGKESSIMLDPIDSTVPLDETGGYSDTGGYSASGMNTGFSRLNSNKAYSELEEVASPVRLPSMDFGSIAPHDPATESAAASSLQSSHLDMSSSLQSNEEEAFGNIDEYEDEDFDDDIETEHVFEEDDEYYYDYEIEDPEEEEIDDGDMEEGTLSWDEEEYLSTIEEESYGDGYSR